MLRLTTLGAIDLRDRRGHPVREILGQPKRLALLIYLAVECRRSGGPVARDQLLALFWPESDAAHARNTLSQALHQLRQTLGVEVIESHGATAVGIRGDHLWCDATMFLEMLERGDVDLALDVYRGEFCPTLFASGAPELERWLDARRGELRRRALAAARTAAEQLAARDDLIGAARAARRALSLRPDDEADVRAMLALLERGGDVASALLAFQEYARWLEAELETKPDPQTTRLIEAMRRRRELDAGSRAPESLPDDGVPPARAASRPPVPAPTRWHSRLRTSFIAAVGLGLLMLTGAITYERDGGAATPADQLVAVFPFRVHGSARHEYLREGMVDLLSAKLDGAVGLHAIDPRSAIAGARRDSIRPGALGLSRVARQLGAGWFVTGDAVPSGSRLQLNGVLHDLRPGSEIVSRASVSGDTTALFELVDDLAGRLLAGVTRGRDSALTRLAAVTTRSLPALKAFLEGEREVRAGRDAQAAAAFREATQLDTAFALAQYRLSIMSTWISIRDVPNAKHSSAAAARHADRLTPLIRDLLTAYGAYQAGRGDEAERMYRLLTESHPENVEAWMMLGETLFHYNWTRGRSAGEAWSVFERVLSLDSTNAHAVLHLARLAASQGRAGALDTLVARYLVLHRDAERALEMRALQAYVHDDPALRAAVTADLRQADEFVQASVLQAALFFAQNFEKPRELAAPYLSTGRGDVAQVRVGRRMLTDVALARGRWDLSAATDILGSAVDRDWLLETSALIAADPFFAASRAHVAALRDSVSARRTYPMLTYVTRAPTAELGASMRSYLLGLLSIRLGDRGPAMQQLATLLAVRDERAAGAARLLARGLRAELARSRGDLAGALEELESFRIEAWEPGVFELAHWGLHERFLHAELLLALGRDREALPWYDTFTLWDLPYLPAADLRRGEILERIGERERARFYYARAAKAWQGCDETFRALLTRARDGLVRVSSGPVALSPAGRESSRR